MNTYLISYDLVYPENREDYVKLINYIKTYDKWAKPLKSVWLIKTSKTISQIRDELINQTDLNDKIFVIDITRRGWATSKISKDVTDWMKNNL